MVKVESVQRPDGTRLGTAYSSVGDRPWELAPLFHGANTNKRDVTLDFTDPEGLAIARRLLATCDVLIENYTPRVLERFGLARRRAPAARTPGLIVLRMPAWGLDGEWRDRPGFAETMEQVTGLAWVTGHPGGAPIVPRGPCDPLGGLHATFALLAALELRDRTGVGTTVEAPLVESALNVAAEQVAVFRATGELLGRDGNRSRFAAPQNVYRAAGDERWVAIAVETDAQWSSLRARLGDPEWARDPQFATRAGRHAARDDIDRELAAMVANADRDELSARARRRGRAGRAGGEPPGRGRQRAARGHGGSTSRSCIRWRARCASPASPRGGTQQTAPWHHRPAPAAGRAQRRDARGAGGRRRRAGPPGAPGT